MAIDLRFLLRRRRTGPDAAPADHLSGELAVAEPGNAFYYGYGLDADGVSANASHLLFRSDGTRIWHDIVGASDGSTAFVGDGSGLTGIVADSAGEVAWDDVTGKPATFAPSAHTHAWSTITGKPTTLSGFGITDAATAAQGSTADTAFGWGDHASAGYLTSVSWGAVTGKPAFATVATTGAYSDLTGKPVLFDGAYSSLTGIPATFAPSAHTHTVSQITDFDPADYLALAGGTMTGPLVADRVEVSTNTITTTSDLFMSANSLLSGGEVFSVMFGRDGAGRVDFLDGNAKGTDGTTGSTRTYRFDAASDGTTLPTADSAVNRAKGDARYSQIGHTHAWSTITGKPTTLSGFGITDAATAAQGSTADTAFGWGDHASAGYLTSVSWGAVTGKPAFATVATTGAYSDLSGKPTLFDGAYGSLTGIPATFAPSAHTHPATAISDSTTLGRALLLAATAAGARTDLELGSAALEDIADGSNANGSYAEIGPFVICWHTIALGSILAAGSGTLASPYRTNGANWTFPQAFSVAPFFKVSLTPDAGGALALDARPMVEGPTGVTTTTLFNIRAHRLSSNNAATNVTAHVFAWGLA